MGRWGGNRGPRRWKTAPSPSTSAVRVKRRCVMSAAKNMLQVHSSQMRTLRPGVGMQQSGSRRATAARLAGRVRRRPNNWATPFRWPVVAIIPRDTMAERPGRAAARCAATGCAPAHAPAPRRTARSAARTAPRRIAAGCAPARSRRSPRPAARRPPTGRARSRCDHAECGSPSRCDQRIRPGADGADHRGAGDVSPSPAARRRHRRAPRARSSRTSMWRARIERAAASSERFRQFEQQPIGVSSTVTFSSSAAHARVVAARAAQEVGQRARPPRRPRSRRRSR